MVSQPECDRTFGMAIEPQEIRLLQSTTIGGIVNRSFVGHRKHAKPLHPTTLYQRAGENQTTPTGGQNNDQKLLKNESDENVLNLAPFEHPSLNCLRFLGQLVRQPIETLIQSLAGSGTSSLNVPVTLAERVKTELVCNIRCIHSIWQILQDIDT